MNNFMQLAIKQAKQAAISGEVPVGAVVVERATKNILAQTHNLVETSGNPTQHAEIIAISEASTQRTDGQRLRGCDLYVTLEPCPMCAGAISHARIETVYFGAYDPKGGGITHGPKVFESSSCHHSPEVIGGIMERECGQLLKDFFSKKR